MITIVSKRHLLKFYLVIVLATIFFIAIATALLFIFINTSDKERAQPKKAFMPVFSIGCYVFAGYSLYRYFRNAPTITLSKDFVIFNNETFPIEDIEKVELTGKKPFKYAITYPMEAATLSLKGGVTKYIFDDMYSNSWEIKSFLKQVVVEKKEFFPPDIATIAINSVPGDVYETFKGNQFTSLRGILLWGSVGYLTYMLITSKRPDTAGIILLFSGLSLFWFILFSYQMHYFQVSDNYLFIRNHNLFWRKKAYVLSDIKEIVFETQGKMPNCLRVITKDFKSNLYPAGTLRDKTWLALKNMLESYHIEVRNECV